jgi:hypothetical protein
MNDLENKWSVELLTSLRKQGDPLADNVVHQVFEHGEVGSVNRLLGSLVKNDAIPPEGLPPEIYHFLENLPQPECNRELIAEAEDLFIKHGNLALVVLLCASLPECYTMKKGVEVLWLTQRLEEHVLRRLLETAQMVVSVMARGGLSPQGKGIRAATKVRLMHAAIRHLIICKDSSAPSEKPRELSDVLAGTHWDVEKLGVPINQEDMLYTLLTFSMVIPRGLERLGVVLTDRQKDAFIHTWNVVGTIMGIRPEVLPNGFAEAQFLFARIKQLEGGASQPGERMTAALLACIERALSLDLLRSLPCVLMRQLLEPETVQWLAVPEPTGLGAVVGGLLLLQIWSMAEFLRTTHDRAVQTIWRYLSRRVMRYLLNLNQRPGWNRTIFTLPKELASGWRVRR